MNILKLASDRRQELIAMRRHFHKFPEPGWQEFRTAETIRAALSRLGVAFAPIPPTGIVATIQGDQPGKTISLRADMDALPLTEKNGHDYVSRNPGFSHACGHDAHMAMLLGAAAILNDLKSHFKGTVKLIFQPAEEIFGGACTIIEAGALKGVDGIFGLHILGRLPVGQAAVAAGAVMAASNHFTVTVTGSGGHGGLPHQGVDALLAAAAIVMNLQAITSREINPLDTAVVSLGRLEAGSAYNILAGTARMEGTTRCFTEEINTSLAERMERMILNTAHAYAAEAELEYTRSVPPTVNDPFCTGLAEKTIDAVCGPDNRTMIAPMTGSEDFAYYLQQIPGVFVFLGGGNKDDGLYYPQHHESFDIDEAALEIGAALYTRFAIDFLAAG